MRIGRAVVRDISKKQQEAAATAKRLRYGLPQAQRESRRNAALWRAEASSHEAVGERQHPSDPSDPWSATEWSVCTETCIHNQQRRDV